VSEPLPPGGPSGVGGVGSSGVGGVGSSGAAGVGPRLAVSKDSTS
jgi:hypothetical protein